jgi:hypothetical protein
MQVIPPRVAEVQVVIVPVGGKRYIRDFREVCG